MSDNLIQIKSQEELDQLYNLIGQQFKFFIEEIIGLTNAPFHDEIDDIISNALYKFICIAIARDHGKSTHLSVSYPLWEVAKNHNLRILIISSTAATASSFLREILNHIEKNERYNDWARWIDPTHKGVIPKISKHAKRQEKWSGTAITVERDSLTTKDPTINAVGLFGSILAKRADIILLDDLVNQINSATEEQRKKVIDWLYTTVLPVLVPGGRIIYAGNTWHVDDLVSHLLKDPQVEYKKRLGAIQSEPARQDLWQQWASIRINEALTLEERIRQANEFYHANKAAMDEGVKVLWPERYSYGTLYLKRLANSYAFSRMYQCDPSENPDQRIKEAWLDRAKELGKALRLQDEARKDFIMEVTAAGQDLAISEKETADDSVYLALDRVKIGNGVLGPGYYIIRQVVRGKISPNQVKENIKEKNATIQPLAVRVETVGYQEAIFRDLVDDGVVNITSYHTGGEKNDSDIGINSIAILLELGRLVIPYDLTDARTIQLMSQLVDELRVWPVGHTGDALMALWFAFSEIRDITSGNYSVPGIMGLTAPKKGQKLYEEMTPEDIKEEEKKIDAASYWGEEEKRLFRGF